MFTSTEKLKEIENKIFNKYFNNQYSRLAEPNNYAWFRKYHFNQTQAIPVDYHPIRNEKIYPKLHHKLYCYPVNILANSNKLKLFKDSDLYGRLEPLKKFNEKNITNLYLFVNGSWLSDDTRILLTEKWIFIEFYDDNTNIDLDIISFNRKVNVLKGNDILNYNYPDDISETNVLFFKNGNFSRNFILEGNTFIALDITENDFVMFSPEIQVLYYPDSGTIFNYVCNTHIVNMKNILVFDEELGLRNIYNENNFRHIMCGIMSSQVPLKGYIVLFKTKSIGNQKVINVPYIEKYIQYFDFNFDFIQNSLPFIIKNHKGVQLNESDTFLDLINIDKDIYEEYLDGITNNTYIFKYNKLPEQFKNISNNYRYCEMVSDCQEFLKEFFMIAFPCKKYFNLFYNGRLMRDSAIHVIFNNRICYCFISKEKFTDYKTAIIEVQVMDDVKDYIRFKREVIKNNTALYGLQDFPVTKLEDKSKLRVFHNGRLVNPLDYTIIIKKNTLKNNYLLLKNKVNAGDIVVIEYFNVPPDIFNTSERLTGLLEINNLKYPLCDKYYDFYIQGIKHNDITRITNKKIMLNNCKDLYDLRVILKPEYNETEAPYLNNYSNITDWWEIILQEKGDNNIYQDYTVINNPLNKVNRIQYTDEKLSYYILYTLFLKFRHVVADQLIVEEEILEYCKNIIQQRFDKEDVIIIDANMEDQLYLYPIPAKEEYYMNAILPDVLKTSERTLMDANEYITMKTVEKTAFSQELHKILFPTGVILVDANFEYTRNDFMGETLVPNRELIEGAFYRWIEYVEEKDYDENNGKLTQVEYPQDMIASFNGELDYDSSLFNPPIVPKQ